MAGKDIAEKLLEECNDVFVDIVNVLYFKEELIKAENLEEAPTEFHYWVQDKSKCRELRRDVAKVLKIDGIPKAIICIENQTCIDPTMPFRIQEYDGATYLMQLKNGEKKLIPIITIVLYFGKVRWSKPITVKEALTQEYNADIKFVNNICDYKMNLYEISFLSEEIRNKFTSDFKIIADYFAGTRNNITDYKPTGQKIVHLKEFLYFMDVFAEDSRFGTSIYEIACKQKGAVSMCELLDLYWDKGKAEGKAEERISMLLCYISKGNSELDAVNIFGATKEELTKVKELIAKQSL